MISTVTYNGDGATRVFPVAFEIKGEDYVVVFLNDVAVSDRTKYDIINNSIVFRVGDEPTTGTNNIEIVVASSPTEIADLNAPPSTVQVVVDNITGLQRIVDTILPVLPEILQADDNAAIATTKAGEASASATEASTSANNALTSEQNADVSEASALTYKTQAESARDTATAQAGIATTKANEASASASSALTSANNASTSEDNALLYANNAKGYADSINPSLLVSSTEYSTHLSVPASYHIYNGQLSLSNTVTTTGFNTTLYIGNGTTQSITTGVDMYTQWGNDTSEKFGGLVWLKSRSATTNNFLFDTLRGTNNEINSNTTEANATLANSLTSFNSDGFSLGGAAGVGTNAATYASWNFQTTHRVSGTTNHGKAYTCHYNPFTGFTIVKYEGSGIAGHEIPHYLGRKLGFSIQKKLTATGTWRVFADTRTYAPTSLRLDGADALFTDATLGYLSNDNSLILSTNTDYNASSNTYIMYGWSNSYFDEKSTLIGNYEIGVYQGTGAIGNKIITKGKPAWIMTKRLDSTSNWYIFDNKRTDGTYLEHLYPNLANAETTNQDLMLLFSADGFTLNNSIVEINASGGQYLYMVVYDNDSGSGQSKYPKATDTSTLNLNAHVPFANGIDATGNKVSIAYKNETITLSNALTQGKNYIALLNDGSYVATAIKPSYGIINPSSGDFFNLGTQKWYSNLNVEIAPRNYLDCIIYADQNGQPEYVEQLPKPTYLDKVSIQNGFDLNQTWQNVKASRSKGVTYTNTTGKPIMVAISVYVSSDNEVNFNINGVNQGAIASQTGASGVGGSMALIVPNGNTYSISGAGGASTWFELR